MLVIPSRRDLATMTEAASAVIPTLAVGLVRECDDGRVSVLCSHPYGMRHYVLSSSDVPEALLARAGEVRHAAGEVIRSKPDSAIEWQLISAGVQSVLAGTVPYVEPLTRVWIGFSDGETPASDRRRAFDVVAKASADLLNAAAPRDRAGDELRRLELAAGLLPALLRVLDVREVFDRLSDISQAALAHDMLTLVLFSDDLETMTMYARTGQGDDIGRVIPQAYPPAVTAAWDFDIIDDRAVYPLERDGPATRLGMRSSLRLPFKFDGRVMGGLAFHSRVPSKYASADVIVGRRLADHVAVALFHHRLAEEGRRAAALQERAANLTMLDGLLHTLTGVLDVREVFDRVSAIAQKVLPHDALSIAESIDHGERVRIHASYGLGQLPEPLDITLPDPTLITEPWDFRLIDDVRDHPEYAHGPGWAAGMRSMLFVPIRLEGRHFGGLNFYSKVRGHYTRDDVLIARRITDHVALALSHRLLAEEARRNEELRAQATNIELLDALLATLIDSGDLPDVFGRISAIAGKVLPHDAVALVVSFPDGLRARVYASSGFPSKLPEIADIPQDILQKSDWEHDILDDITCLTEPRYTLLADMGFESMLRVPIRLDGKFAGALVFVSRSRAAFKQGDVLIGRRIADRMAVTLARGREMEASRRADEATARASKLEARVQALTDELDARTGYRRVIGESRQWRQVLTQAAQVSATDTTVLLLGESGTGKEVVARFLHRGSSRNTGPFIAINCAALPEQLLEAELFGYERGAFTGATQSKPGQLEQAAGGTLFLDEVAEMSPSAQAKFLRVLQEREFQRLGGTRVQRTDTRVVAATNRDLQRAISQGQFREDLYYRLNVFAIRLPALRDRKDDVLPLSDAFLTEIGRGLGRPPGGISREARELLVEYHWPGNVRELRNILERAAILCDGGLITPDHLALSVAPLPMASPSSPIAASSEEFAAADAPTDATPESLAAGDLPTMERVMIEQALETARFNKSKAAKALGLTRHQLYTRMRKYGLE